MDARYLDSLARALSKAGSRRRALAAALGSALGLGTLMHPHDAAAGVLDGGYACFKDRQCRTGLCLRNGKCACSRDFRTCKPPANACKKATCKVASGRCVTKPRAAGIGCTGDDSPCTNGACNGKGTCTQTNKPDGASCGDGRQCSRGICITGSGTCEPGADACDGTPILCNQSSGNECYCATTLNDKTRCAEIFIGFPCGCTSDAECRDPDLEMGPDAFCAKISDPTGCAGCEGAICVKPCPL
jgi:hypothetical protein